MTNYIWNGEKVDRLTYIWEILVDYNVATDDELSLATSLCGYKEETLNDVLYIRTGYRDIEQYCGVADNFR